ncbi:uncharacterized protein LOC117320703 [Pecten maximus]|uniref:uncharacterized protein LOC117320703 n=1 Tax=Pecten maximus TaxID=6579 RepID=UPI0014584E45|nr:uncharacterized protein LOC117320703 [Pecten maximus]
MADDERLVYMINAAKKRPFSCVICKFSTKRKDSYRKHEESSKHQRNLKVAQTIHVGASNYEQYPENTYSSDFSEDENVNWSCAEPDIDVVEDITLNAERDDAPIEQDDVPTEQDDAPTEQVDEQIDQDDTQTDQDEWKPFSSKAHFYLCVLSGSKTHHVSDEILKFIIYMMKSCGTPGVPSFEKVKNIWSDDLDIDKMLKKNTDKDGNISWMIKPMEILKLQISNPKTAKKIARYPTVETTIACHRQSGAAKWMQDINFPWAKIGDTTFLQNMFVRFECEGQENLGQIKKFMDDIENDKMLAELEIFCYNTDENNGTPFIVQTGRYIQIPLDECVPEEIVSNILVKRHQGNSYASVPIPEEEKKAMFELTPLWKGLPIINVPVNVFMDDLSSNKSRRWSPLHSIQMQLAGLPLKEKRKGSSTLYLASSDTVGILDMMAPICADIEESKSSAVDAFDAENLAPVVLCSQVSLLVTDYHMMSHACNHSGPSATKYCPKCMADKTDPLRKSELRTPNKTQRILHRMNIMTNTKTLQKETGVKPYGNPLWKYINPHRDTPIGVLHFLYLGLAKHLIKLCYESLSPQKKDELKVHLDSIDQTGFSYKVSAKSMLQYLDSRQGKDFKHYLQLAPFNFQFVGADRKHIMALKKLALISKHMQQLEGGIADEVEDYLNFVHEHLPSLTRKSKAHLGVHLADDILRHGHPLQYLEDPFEKNHGCIRQFLFHQNQQAKSRDCARQFAKSELLAHLISGGFLKSSDSWHPPGHQVVSEGCCNEVARYLGNQDDEGHYHQRRVLRLMDRLPNGKPNDMSSDPVVQVQALQAALACGGDISLHEQGVVHTFRGVKTASGRDAKVGQFVTYKEDGEELVGRLRTLMEVNQCRAAEIERCRRNDLQRVEVSRETPVWKDIKSLIEPLHCIHSCREENCAVQELPVPRKTEQEFTTKICKTIKHKDRVFLINTYRLTHSKDFY